VEQSEHSRQVLKTSFVKFKFQLKFAHIVQCVKDGFENGSKFEELQIKMKVGILGSCRQHSIKKFFPVPNLPEELS
jgi:hypothetical protein